MRLTVDVNDKTASVTRADGKKSTRVYQTDTALSPQVLQAVVDGELARYFAMRQVEQQKAQAKAMGKAVPARRR